MHMHACTCTCPFSPMHATLCQCKPNVHMCTLNEGHSWTYEGPFPYRSRKVKSLVFKTVLLQVREIGLQNLATDYKTNIFQHLCTCARALGHLCMLTPLVQQKQSECTCTRALAHVHFHLCMLLFANASQMCTCARSTRGIRGHTKGHSLIGAEK